MSRTKAVIMADDVPFFNGDIVDYVYGRERIERIRAIADLHPERITSRNLAVELPKLCDVEVIFSCWGIVKLTPEQLSLLPKLKAVFYAGGSVQHFASPYQKKGITVCTALEANAIPVAEFCLAQILLACKGAYRNSQLCRKGPWKQSDMPVGKGVYGETVALVGIGAISRHLCLLLKPFNLRIIAVSGYLSHNPDQAKALGIDRLVTLDEAFKEAYVVSNHLPDKPENRTCLTLAQFSNMRPDATFINTGRGAQVDEAGLVEVLKARPDLTALLDVQHPEPPEPGSELYRLPNVHMTSHIAGSTNDEVRRMADFMIDDFQRWQKNEPLRYAVDACELKGRA